MPHVLELRGWDNLAGTYKSSTAFASTVGSSKLEIIDNIPAHARTLTRRTLIYMCVYISET